MTATRNKKEIKTQESNAATWLGFLMVLIVVCGSALGVVYAAHESRHLLNALQTLEEQRNDLQVEWGQLLLEQSSLISQGRVEDIAIKELGMKIPAMENMVVVKQ